MFELAMLSDVGCGRPTNQDACGRWVESPGEIVFAVADGIGGYEGGEVASRLAIDVTLAAYRNSSPAWGPARRLERAAHQANTAIHDHALAEPALGRMGTTLTAVAVSGGVLSAVHVGDCRLYLLRGNALRQLTRDHNLAGERVRSRLLSAAAARHHPDRTVLTRSLGASLIAPLERLRVPLEPGDQLVLCSDGLYTVLEDWDLVNLCRRRDALAACRRLIEAANRRSPTDNLTAVVLNVHEGTAPAVAAADWRRRVLGLLKLAD